MDGSKNVNVGSCPSGGGGCRNKVPLSVRCVTGCIWVLMNVYTCLGV